MSEKTIQLNVLRLNKYPEFYKEFLNNLKTVLQKIGSSNKTKAIHAAVEKEICSLGFGTVDISGQTTAEYGSSLVSGGKLNALVADAKHIVDPSDRTEIAGLYSKFVTATNELSRAKTTISEASEININRIEKELKSTLKEIMDLIDFFKLVDVYYYLYIEALAKEGVKGSGKVKLMETVYEVLKTNINKTIKKYSKSDLTYEANSKIDVIFDYIFTITFTKLSPSEVISKLTKGHGKENTDILRDIGAQKYTQFKNIGEMLTKANIINITDSMIMKELARAGGEKIEDMIEGDVVELIAYLVSNLYKSTLFEMKVIDESSQKRLEELVLNFKRDLVISKS